MRCTVVRVDPPRRPGTAPPGLDSGERHRRNLRSVAATGLVGLLLATFASGVVAKPPPGSPAELRAQTTEIQILSLNDFHGQLQPVDPLASSGGRIGSLASGACVAPGCIPAGGVEYLAAHVGNLRADNPNTAFVSAGDPIR